MHTQLSQDHFYKLCMRAFKTSNADSYDASVEIAEGLVPSFFEIEAIRPFGPTSGNEFLMVSELKS